jgi:hypothetical protein
MTSTETMLSTVVRRRIALERLRRELKMVRLLRTRGDGCSAS